jgi:tetratricopeptide (TPR) repeat protein/predicted Ser/Thr protein kinase
MFPSSPPTRRDPSTTPSRPPRAPRPAAGARFGRYELLAEVGRGGMGVVYRARQPDLDRVVALKMLLVGDAASEVERERFFAEAKHAAKLSHRAIVSVHDVGETDGIHYFTMDYVEGKDLGELIRAKGRLEPREAVEIALQLCDGLAYAHEQGVVHRDMKPSNVLLDEKNGRPRITDFGIAKDLGRSSTTRAGEVLGTPSYMPPEQAEGRALEVDNRADIYSLGAVLYDMLTGHPPFEGKSGFAILTAVINERPRPLRKLVPALPEDLETIVLKCLEKDRAKRYATVSLLAADLRRFATGESIEAEPASEPILSTRAKLLVLGALLVAGLVGGVVVYVRDLAAREEAERVALERTRREADEASRRAREAEEQRAAAEKGSALVRDALEAASRQDSRALGLAAQAVEHAPRLVLARATLARLELELARDAPRALAEADAAIALDAAAVDARSTRVRALVALGRYADALAECDALDKLVSGAGRAAAARLRGETDVARGDLGTALGELQRAADMAPGDADVRLTLARAFLAAKKPDDAERAASAAHELEPRLGSALLVRAEARAQLGRFADALADAQEAASLAPSDPAASALVARLQQADEREDSPAHQELHRAAEAAEQAFARGDRAAVEAWLAAPRRGRECPRLLASRGYLLWHTGRLPEADEVYTRLHDLNAADAPALGNRGLVREQEKRWDEALADFDEALGKPGGPGMWPALEGRARILSELGRFEEAETAWTLALESVKDPAAKAHELHDRAKFFWLSRGRLDEAQADFDQAIALVPGSGHYWRDRGDVKEKKGDLAGALADWKAALDGKALLPGDLEHLRAAIEKAESR